MYQDKYYPDNLEFPWKKSLIASALLMVAAKVVLPIGVLAVGLVGLGTMAASFIRNRFIRYSLASYANADFDFGRTLIASDQEVIAMDQGVKAADSTWEYVKSFQPWSPAFRHWVAFSAGLAAQTATDYYHSLNGHIIDNINDRMKGKPKPGEETIQPKNNAQLYDKLIPVLIACSKAFSEKVQHFPVRLLNRDVVCNYFDLNALDFTIESRDLFETQEEYLEKCKNAIKDANKYKVEGNNPDDIMLAFQKFASEYFNVQGISIHPKETAKKILKL